MARNTTPTTYTCDVCGRSGLAEKEVMYVVIQIGRRDRWGTGEYAPRDGFENFDVCHECLGGSKVIQTFYATHHIEVPAKRLMSWVFPNRKS